MFELRAYRGDDFVARERENLLTGKYDVVSFPARPGAEDERVEIEVGPASFRYDERGAFTLSVPDERVAATVERYPVTTIAFYDRRRLAEVWYKSAARELFALPAAFVRGNVVRLPVPGGELEVAVDASASRPGTDALGNPDGALVNVHLARGAKLDARFVAPDGETFVGKISADELLASWDAETRTSSVEPRRRLLSTRRTIAGVPAELVERGEGGVTLIVPFAPGVDYHGLAVTSRTIRARASRTAGRVDVEFADGAYLPATAFSASGERFACEVLPSAIVTGLNVGTALLDADVAKLGVVIVDEGAAPLGERRELPA